MLFLTSGPPDRPTNKITEWLPADQGFGNAGGDDLDDDVSVNWDGDF